MATLNIESLRYYQRTLMGAPQLLAMLTDLAEGWELKLESKPGEEHFTLTLGRTWHRAEAAREFIYIGSLDSVIQRAWAGGPPDKLGDLV